jgi:hypothetical protein
MKQATIGKVLVSRLCIGGNPFSGFSHQNPERDRTMLDYFTPERIKADLRAAETAGINTFFGRTDDHILGILQDYWEEGGRIQWFAQVCVDRGQPESWRKWFQASVQLGASGAYIHGGVVDHWFASGLFDNFHEALGRMRQAGVAAGFAGHNPEAHDWIRQNLEVDFQMCCHYNPTDRSRTPHHIGEGERWEEEDRQRMLQTIRQIGVSVVHYKVFAGGNRPIVPAFELLGREMRPNDVACVGMFTKDDPDMIARNVALFERRVEQSGA